MCDTEALQKRERAGIDGVAAQLVTWKARAIEELDADAGARQYQRRYCPGRAGAGDCDLKIGGFARSLTTSRTRQALPMTIALFLEPNPRQLQSAASTAMARPVLGMKSRSQSGSGVD